MFETIYLMDPNNNALISPYTVKGKRIGAAESFSVRLASVVVAEDLDGFLGGKNDVFVMTRSALGKRPRVERVHFYGEEIETGKPIRNLFANLVFVEEDYNPLERLWIELNVIEIDSDSGERKAAINAFQSMASTAGAVFPAIVPYSFAASAAIGLVERLVSALEKDDEVVKLPISLHGSAAMIGEMPLQVGTYIAFARPVNPAGLKLSQSGLLQGSAAKGLSYVVFNVAGEKQISHTEITSQRIATLLTQLRDGNPQVAKSAIEFLGDTLTAYGNFGKLNRYLELKEKKAADLTPPEKGVMDAIKKIPELKPFLPKNT